MKIPYNYSSNALNYYTNKKNKQNPTINHKKHSKRYQKRLESQNDSFKALSIALNLISVIVFFFVMVIYLQQIVCYQDNNYKIVKLQAQLSEQTRINDVAEIELQNGVSIPELYRIATEELGMIHPNNQNIVWYPHIESGYVQQFQDIE